MTTPVDETPEDNKPAVDKKPEPRKRKSDSKRIEPTAASATAAQSDPAKAESAESTDRESMDENIERRKEPEAGTALAPAGVRPIDPFLAAKAEEKVEPPPPPRSFASRMLDYSAHAAIIVGLIGFAWTVSGHVIGQKKGDAAVATAKAPGKPDELADLRLANIKLHEEIKALKANVDAMRTTAKRDTTPEQLRVLSAGLDNVKNTLGAAKSETSAALAQMQGKIEKLSPGKMQALAERIGRLEHPATDTASTGSIARAESPSRADVSRSDAARSSKPAPVDTARSAPSKEAPTPPAKPAALAKLDDKGDAAEDGKPQTIPGWTVRDVYQGVALIEGKRGATLEVVPGVAIPGAGVVKSIERKGGGWVVTTSKGQLAYAGAAAQREQRDQRAYRRGGGYDYGGYGRYAPYRDGY